MLACEVTKVVTVIATSMDEARGLIYNRLDEGQMVGAWGEHYGRERVVDVVREGEPWHFERKRKPADSGEAGR